MVTALTDSPAARLAAGKWILPGFRGSALTRRYQSDIILIARRPTPSRSGREWGNKEARDNDSGTSTYRSAMTRDGGGAGGRRGVRHLGPDHGHPDASRRAERGLRHRHGRDRVPGDRALHRRAERGQGAPAVRTIRGDRPHGRPPVGEPVLQEKARVAAHPQLRERAP